MDFKDRVYSITGKIPKGKVATYGQIAKLAGSPKAARAVGMLMKCNPDPKTIPCHRVVGHDGKLVGYSNGGVKVKKQTLLFEGVKFLGDKVNLKASHWSNQEEEFWVLAKISSSTYSFQTKRLKFS